MGLIYRKRLGPATKSQLTEAIIKETGVAVSRTCKIVSLPRSQFYSSSKKDDAEVIGALQELTFQHPLWLQEARCLLAKTWAAMES